MSARKAFQSLHLLPRLASQGFSRHQPHNPFPASCPRLCRAQVPAMSLSTTVPQAFQPLPTGKILLGESGRRYVIDEVLYQRRVSSTVVMGVYRASTEGKQFVVKDIGPDEFLYQKSLQERVSDSPFIRTMTDAIPEGQLFVYPYISHTLLQIDISKLSLNQKKYILKRVLMGLVDLHSNHILHNDVKPNNIMLDLEEDSEGNKTPKLNTVQLTDLEDSVHLPPPGNIQGGICGNEIWRSPESWTKAKQNLPSDIFSFGILCIYVVLHRMVLYIPESERNGEEPWRVILRRQLSYFGDLNGVDGLLEHVGGKGSPEYERLIEILNSFGEVHRYNPFRYWDSVDPDFRDLVTKMTNMDPAKRITAQDALAHPWFGDVDVHGA